MTERVKRIYCEENNLAVGIYEEPIFNDRIRLFGHSIAFYNYRAMINRLGENEYFKMYKDIKNRVIEYIQNTSTFQEMQKVTKDAYDVKLAVEKLPRSDIYKDCNIGDDFISIDMIKGNFNSYVTLSRIIDEADKFNNGSYNYNNFISQFTDEGYLINSRDFRQQIFGKCAPSETSIFERYITRRFLAKLLDMEYINISDIVTVHDDEIVLRVTDTVKKNLEVIKAEVRASESPLSYQMYSIWKITDTYAYIKHIFDGKDEGKDIVKNARKREQPSIYRFLANEKGDCSDLMYIDEMSGKKAMLLEKYALGIEKEKQYDKKYFIDKSSRKKAKFVE